MRYQSKKFTCGPTSLANALEALGLVRTEDELSVLAGTQTDGTSQAGLEKALTALQTENVGFSRFCEQRREVARWAILGSVRSGCSMVIAVDNWEHWVAVVGILGNQFVVADSGGDLLLEYYGVEELLDRWCSSTGRFHGVIIWRT